uniref:Uncharacterized protein n=1 Tax=Daucus carota subsp. sativus TaxID=79200 RepID=A0A161XV07_DAUCS
MPSPHHRLPPFVSALRNPITWFFISVLILYLLYSSNVALYNDKANCSLPSELLNPREALQTVEHLSNSSLTTSPDEDHNSTSLMLPQTTTPPPPPPPPSIQRFDTKIKHIAFGIAASEFFWENRKEYIKQWWRPGETRGVVWLDKNVSTDRNEGLPEIRISGDTSQFKYTNTQGDRSALRIARVVSETLRLGMKDIRWFVMGDDDTVFMVENVVRVLSKYDHNELYYIGCISESHVQNIVFSYAMAFGGGGFALSYPLAKELERIHDRCIQRYPGLYGSDDRMQACMAELGVPLTREHGFHQYDVYGNLLGLLGAHPVTPLVSLHHLDVLDPVYPKMTRVQAIHHLFEAAKYDSASIAQQSICYDRNREWSISVSWGYVVQIIRGVLSPRELEMPTRTFLNWYKKADYTAYAFNTRPFARQPCQKPYVYYMTSMRYDEKRRQIVAFHSLNKDSYPNCRWQMDSPEEIDDVIVMKKPDNDRWQKKLQHN